MSSSKNAAELEAHVEQRLFDLYRTALAARDFEIAQLTHRNNFLMVFQGVMFAGLAQASGGDAVIPVVAFMICLTGLTVALLQIGMAAGAKFWKERWEAVLEQAERRLRRETPAVVGVPTFRVFSAPEEHVRDVVRERVSHKFLGTLISGRFSPSRIPILVAAVLAFMWFLLLICTVSGPFRVPSFITGFPI